MKGAPFSAAWKAAWSAGQVEILQRDFGGGDGGAKPPRRAIFAERNTRRLDRGHEARADQEVGLDAGCGRRDEAQAADAAADDFERGGERCAGIVGGYGELGAMRDAAGQFLKRRELIGHRGAGRVRHADPAPQGGAGRSLDLCSIAACYFDLAGSFYRECD